MKDLTIHFILSQPRSGSTLLRLILSKAENIISLPETHFFVFKKEYAHLEPSNENDRVTIAKNWTNYHTVKKMNINIENLSHEIISSGDSWKKIFEISIAHYSNIYFPLIDNPTFIEKSPPHIFFIDDILKMYPKSKLVHLVRDPRAVIASLRNMSWATSNIYTLSKSWNKSSELINKHNDVLTIKYEDLTSSPKENIDKLTHFLDINSTIENYDKGIEDHVELHKLSQQEIKKPINTENINKWKKMLSGTDGEIQLIESICKEKMLHHNYELLNLKKNNGYYASKTSYLFHFILLKLLNLVRK